MTMALNMRTSVLSIPPLALRQWLARRRLLDFVGLTMASYRAAAHHATIAAALEAVEAGTIKRLVITMPPRHGKSELASIQFPAWYLGRNPDKRVILASYADSLALTFGRQIRNLVRGEEFGAVFPGINLAQDSTSADHWNIEGRRGGLIAAGVGSGITGHGADLLIIDDPVKDASEADSPTIRASKWEWYTRTAYTRLQTGGAIVLIGTRWHVDDLIGRALDQGNEGWHVLHLPAIDADGRALWAERYPPDELQKIKDAIGLRAWESLYQGRPVIESGGIFERGWFGLVDVPQIGGRDVRFWDFAATEKKMKGDPDYTAGVKMRYVSGRFFVLDVVHVQANPADVDRIVVNTAAQDGRACAIRWEAEGGASGKRDSQHLAKMLVGYDAQGVQPQGDKVLRAKPFAAQVKAENVKLVAGRWTANYLDELASFPYGSHDDMVDATSGAFHELVTGNAPRAKVHN